MDSPFEVLGIEPDADEAAVVRAYRRRVLETHPDQGGSASEFQAVQRAFQRIKDGESRQEPAAGSDEVERPEPETASHVEYLNYEVLDDNGWSLDDEDLFEKAATDGLDPADHGRFRVDPDESLLEAAEKCGFAWPFACRGGACANCAVAVLEGELSQPVDTILPPEKFDSGVRLSCNGMPQSDEMKVVYNLKERPDLDDLRLPPTPFEIAHPGD